MFLCFLFSIAFCYSYLLLLLLFTTLVQFVVSPPFPPSLCYEIERWIGVVGVQRSV